MDRWIEWKAFALRNDEVALAGFEGVEALGETTADLRRQRAFDLDRGELSARLLENEVKFCSCTGAVVGIACMSWQVIDDLLDAVALP